MFFLPDADGPSLVLSATDLAAGSKCLYALKRRMDVLTERAAPAGGSDPMLDMLRDRGLEHERRILDGFRQVRNVLELPSTEGVFSRELLEQGHRDTLAALGSDADVVYQGSFFDGSFHGKADFLIREEDGSWSVNDTKLASAAKPEYRFQLAAYADQLVDAGIPVHSLARIILRNGSTVELELDALLPEYRAARDTITDDLLAHLATGSPADWSADGDGACLLASCPECSAAATEASDLLTVAGMPTAKKVRTRLRAAGITTVEEFAGADLAAAGLGRDERTVDLQLQAKLQVGLGGHDGEAGGVRYKVVDRGALALLPVPDPGDVFFDFEGDPNHREPDGSWGLEYLFGVLERPLDSPFAEPEFIPLTAHGRDQEKEAFHTFMVRIADRLRRYPGMHIYHYAHYEKSALTALAERHGIYREAVELLNAKVLFDLRPVAAKAVRISERSMSIKRLEPLYRTARTGSVATAAASLTAYTDYTAAIGAGDSEAAAAVMDSILAYNRDDCESTLQLRDWLLSL